MKGSVVFSLVMVWKVCMQLMQFVKVVVESLEDEGLRVHCNLEKLLY
jgi:hypothetical protein